MQLLVYVLLSKICVTHSMLAHINVCLSLKGHCERRNNGSTSTSGLRIECSCQQSLIILALFPSLLLSLSADRSSLLGALGAFLAALTALNNSQGPTTMISKRKDRDLEGKDM